MAVEVNVAVVESAAANQVEPARSSPKMRSGVGADEERTCRKYTFDVELALGEWR